MLAQHFSNFASPASCSQYCYVHRSANEFFFELGYDGGNLLSRHQAGLLPAPQLRVVHLLAASFSVVLPHLPVRNLCVFVLYDLLKADYKTCTA